MKNNIQVSIIIVNYNVEKELLDCVRSIKNALIKVNFELIVVDNSQKKMVNPDLKKIFPIVKYIKTQKNKGFGAGNNIGAKVAQGEYLFFLNPDTKVFKNTIEQLVNAFKQDTSIAVVAPLILDKNKNPYLVQGTKTQTPFAAMFSHSAIHTIFPNNPIATRYFLKNWNRKNEINVSVVPGSAFMIKRDIFEKIGGFDEQYFLYFEETDLCLQIERQRLKLVIQPKAYVIHLAGKSTQSINRKQILAQSRFYYFKKNFGTFPALLVEFVSRVGKSGIIEILR